MLDVVEVDDDESCGTKGCLTVSEPTAENKADRVFANVSFPFPYASLCELTDIDLPSYPIPDPGPIASPNICECSV